MIPKVSICVVTYNQRNYIRECLMSILNQETNFDFEIIIGDDFSTDGTTEIVAEIAQKFPSIIRVVNYEKNVGPFVNFNYTHSLATAPYVAHCDGDDLFLPGKLQKQVDFLDAHKDYSVCWHKNIYFNDKGKEVDELGRPHIVGVGETVTLSYILRVGTVATHSSIMYRKSVRKTFNPNFDTLDLYYTIEYLAAGKGMILKEQLGKYRVNAQNSLSSSKNLNSKVRILCIQHWNDALKLYPQYRSQIFIFALLHMFIDLKNKRNTWKGFAHIARLSFGGFNVNELIDTFKSTRFLRIPNEIRFDA